MRRDILISLGLLAFLLSAVTDAFGCSCGRRPTIQDELSRQWVKTVVTGRIESIQKVRDEKGEHDYRAFRSVTLLVDKVYAGDVKKGDRLILVQGNGVNCSFTWDERSVGSEWLFYLGKPTTSHFFPLDEVEDQQQLASVPMYSTSFCGRSTPLAGAARDLAYLENLSKFKGKSRISGDLDYQEGEGRSVEGIEVRLTGKNVALKSKFGNAGFFEFYDVPPGEYLLEISPPRGWVAIDGWRSWQAQEFPETVLSKLRKNQRMIRVAKGGHTDVDLSLTYDTKLAGRVLSPIGKPMPKVCVKAEPVSNDKKERGGQSCTDEKGEFTIEHLRPGNYLLVANERGQIDADQPFGKLYYPGVTMQAEAGVVSIEPASYHVGIDFQIPELNRLIEISGRVLFADDKPLEGVWVKFEPSSEKTYSAESVRTDAEGRFTLTIPFGASGTVRGSKYFSKYDYPNCPMILDIAKESGSEQKTSELELDGTRSISGSVLRFPFDFCAEKKR